MFRKTSAQSSLLELDILFPNILPSDDWAYTYRDEIYPHIDEEKFKHLYSEGMGAPNKSIKVMVSLLIFMGMEKLNWREAAHQLPRRVDWLIALHLVPGEFTVHFTSLFKFARRIQGDAAVHELFQDLVNRFCELCGTSLDKQRTDTFFIHGWLQLLTRYGLLKETIRVFLQHLRKQKPGLYERIKGDLSRDYLKEGFDLTDKDRDEARRQIKKMAADMLALTKAFETHKQVQHYRTFKTLLTVFNQQCEVVESESATPAITIRETPLDEGEGIISSPHNTDARYTRKGDQKVTGDKGLVSETCDQNNQTQFITDVDVMPANTADDGLLPDSLERRQDADLKPQTELADAGLINGEVIVAATEKGVELHGPTKGRSQHPKTFADPERPLDTADFEIEVDMAAKAFEVTACPAGHAPLDQQRKPDSGNTLVHFDRAVCASCPLLGRCPVKLQKRVATVTTTLEEVVGARQHHRFMADPQYREDYRPRAGAEATVSEVTRKHGMRKSRHRCRAGTRVQMIFAAIACNVKRFIRHGQNYGFECPATA